MARRRLPTFALLLAAAVAVVNGVALASLFLAVDALPGALEAEGRTATLAAADAVEGALSQMRTSFLAATRQPSVATLVGSGLGDPAGTTPGISSAEDVLLRLMAAEPSLRALALRDPAGAPLLLVARRDGTALLLPRDEDPPAPIAAPDLVLAAFPVAGRQRQKGLIEGWIDPQVLLAQAVPGFPGRISLAESASPDGISAGVRAPLWSPPIAWTVIHEGGAARRLRGAAATLRSTVVLNLLLLAGTVLLGALGLRAAVRAARFQAAGEQEARLRELERRMHHAERLATVGRLAAGVAHEVNNPLEGMANYLALLDEELAAGRLREARGLVGRVREGVRRVGGLTRRLLDLSAPAAGRLAPLDLRDPIGQAVDLARGTRGAEERIAADLGSVPLPVLGDAPSLAQLFLNLLLNALQGATPPPRVRVHAALAGELVRVTIEDDGPGIAAETLPRLFEAFHSTRGSTGLGLAVCRGIVEEHGGRIAGRNRPTGGAVFEVELPAAEGETPP